MKTGEIQLTQNSSLVFSVEEYRGNVYVSIRVYVTSPIGGYSGPTRRGILLEKNIFDPIFEAIKNLRKQDIFKLGNEKIITEVKKSDRKSIRVFTKEFKGQHLLDIREFIHSDNFTGYTKKGISIKSEIFDEFMSQAKNLRNSLQEKTQKFPTLFDQIPLEVEEAQVRKEPKQIVEERKVSTTTKVRKDKTDADLFSRLFQYYWEIQKNKIGFSNVLDLNKSVDYYDLSEFLGEEKLFSGKVDQITFRLPEKTKGRMKIEGKKESYEDAKSMLEEESFEKIKKLFLQFQERSYEREFLLGFPYVFLSNPENDKTISSPIFLTPCELEYDTLGNTISLRLSADDVQLNFALIGELLGSDAQEYVRKQLVENKPHIPLDEKRYKDYLASLNSLLELGLNSTNLPKDFQLDTRFYKEFIKQSAQLQMTNKAFILLSNKSSYYILENLEQLIKMGQEVGKSILGKFLSQDIGIGDEQDRKSEFRPNEYLFPFKSNPDQRKIVDALAKDLILVQGPPGTGKSQTISNLICHLVANGKKVLVSSQKNKALEVIDQMLNKISLEYLQMVLLKNDTEAKKELIERLGGLDHYVGSQSNKLLTENLANLRKAYSDIDNNIAEYSDQFERVKEAIQNNELLFKKYSTVQHYNMIEDHVTFLEKGNINKYKNLFLSIIRLYKTTLPNEEQIKEFLSSTKCSENNLSKIVSLLKELSIIRSKAKSIFLKEEFKIITQLHKNPIQLHQSKSQLERAKTINELATNYDTLAGTLTGLEKSQIMGMLKDISLSEITEQEKLLAGIVGSLETMKKNVNFSNFVNSDDPDKLRSLLSFIRKMKSSGGFLRFLREFLSAIKRRQYQGVIANDILKKFPRRHILEDLEKACLYRMAEVEILRTCREFCLGPTVETQLKSVHLSAAKLSEKLLELFEFLKISKKILLLLAADLNVSSDNLGTIEAKFGTLSQLAKKLENFYYHHSLLYDEQVISAKLKPFLKDKYQILLVPSKFPEKTKNDQLAEVIEAGGLVSLWFKAAHLEKELSKFPKTLGKLSQSIVNKDNFVKDFELNVGNVLDCELIDNQIKEFERKFPLSTEEIVEKILELKEKKLKTIRDIIQTSIDLNLIANYYNNPLTQREIAYFRRQIRRSTRNYATFEEMKKEFNFQALLDVLPCWVMSIDDVARVFPLKAGLFDYVIIDEASQCSLPSSIPTLFRGKKAIIVGDDKQLSDFTKEWISSTFNEGLIKELRLKELTKFDSLDAKFNSLFDSCVVFKERPVMLTEHFRSYPEIINFSNQRFYNNKLRIMTHSLTKTLDPILNVIKVKGSSENELKINEKEAYEIITHLKEIMSDKKYDGMSIGVLSLFREQANFIRKLMFDDDFIRERIDNYQLIADTVDGFQGDERDVIIYSFRYASNSSPSIFNFTRTEDGWRRVNVAFTRPRKQIFSFISRDIEDFPGGHVKEFLRYSQSPAVSSLPSAKKQFDSEFEEDVYKSLSSQDRKLVIVPQFETCGFRIDFVLLKNGRTLALECDGQQHYTETGELLEEDIDRQDILERAGWVVRRLSSKEFYRNQQGSIQKILDYFGSNDLGKNE